MLKIVTAAALAVTLAACSTTVRDTPSPQVALPEVPADLRPCFEAAFPTIPDRDLSRADVKRIIGGAKLLDRSKTACGRRALSWMESVSREYGYGQ